MPSPWLRLRNVARRMGGDIIAVPYADLVNRCMKGVEGAPFNGALGLNWDKRLVYASVEDIHKPICIGGIIHEMGHVFACRKRPSASNEMDFLGWEYRISSLTRTRRQWLVNMKDYGIAASDLNIHQDFMRCSTYEKKRVVTWALRVGREYGNLGKNNEPLCVRGRR